MFDYFSFFYFIELSVGNNLSCEQALSATYESINITASHRAVRRLVGNGFSQNLLGLKTAYPVVTSNSFQSHFKQLVHH